MLRNGIIVRCKGIWSGIEIMAINYRNTNTIRKLCACYVHSTFFSVCALSNPPDHACCANNNHKT